MEESPILGVPQIGSLPDVVPEGTLLNMVLRRVHRSRSCSYQLLLEHRRPSRIQGLRWVSTSTCGQGQGTWAGKGQLLVDQLARGVQCGTHGVNGGQRGLAEVNVGGSYYCNLCVCTSIWT